MILYIDTYISETGLTRNRELEALTNDTHLRSKAYRKRSRVDVFKYSVASYSIFEWEKAILRIDGDSKEKVSSLRSYLMELFPNSEIALERSDSGAKFAKVLNGFREGNPWVFFSPNNDHPFISNNSQILDCLVKSAESAERKFGLPVSILYSHYTESINSISPSGYLYGYTGDFCEIVDEDEYSYAIKYKHLSLIAVQIFRAQQLYEMMHAAGSNRVVRTEDLGQYLDYQASSIQIVPKLECCRHYDAYMHTYAYLTDYITAARVPPLFIPDGFFEKKIKIKYGYDEYFEEFVNINPLSKVYSFESKSGTDMAVSVDQLPAFWNDRIEHLDINPALCKMRVNENPLTIKVKNPWRDKSENHIKLVVIYRKIRFLFILPLARLLYCLPLVKKCYRHIRSVINK
jgi:hypothetical protein